MDYKVLLLKYIQLVGEAEGVSFINKRYKPPKLFTKEEWEELERLDKIDGIRSEPT